MMDRSKEGLIGYVYDGRNGKDTWSYSKRGGICLQFAVEYYMKAEVHAVLGRHGAERVLDYYSKGGNIQLTEDDVKRFELIVQSKGVETE